MTDSLVSRVKRLVAGSVNDLVDTIETKAPETVMREAVREIEKVADEVRGSLGRTIANRHCASKRLMDTTSKHEELTDRAKFAVEQGRDDLAGAAIARQIDLEAQMPVLEGTLSDLSSEQSELEGYVAALQARKREMEADLASYIESRVSVENESSAAAAGHGGAQLALEPGTDHRANKAQDAFERVLRTASGVGGVTRADSDTSAKLAELELIARDHRVRERLAALKAEHV